MTTTARPPILNRGLILLFVAAFGALTSFYLLLSVVPLYVGTGFGAGLAMGAMMLATVLVELVVPRLLARFGYRAVLAVGLVLLGAPAAALPVTSALPLVLGVSLARGAGLAIVVVAGTALAAELVPAQRRGEGLALYGVAVGIPAVVGLPLGLWLVEQVGFGPVFLAGAVASLAVVAAVIGLPAVAGRVERHGERSLRSEPSNTAPPPRNEAAGAPAPSLRGAELAVLSGLRIGGIARPTVIFAAITFAAGVVVTFLPLAAESARVAAVALLVQSAVTPVARLAAGRFGDRHGSGRLLVPAVLCAAFGTAALVWLDSPLATIGGLALFGVGFGIGQNVTLALMFERVPRSEFGRVSALWNLAYDAGMGIGAVGFGLLVGPIGYAAGFAVTAALVMISLAVPDRNKR